MLARLSALLWCNSKSNKSYQTIIIHLRVDDYCGFPRKYSV